MPCHRLERIIAQEKQNTELFLHAEYSPTDPAAFRPHHRLIDEANRRDLSAVCLLLHTAGLVVRCVSHLQPAHRMSNFLRCILTHIIY